MAKSKKDEVIQPNSRSWIFMLIVVILLVILGILFWRWLFPNKAGATQISPCESYCASWNHDHNQCLDTDYRLCHVNPSHGENLSFNNLQSCENHVGNPHNNSTYDLRGLCPIITPTPSPTPSPTPTPMPTPPVCDEASYSCDECSQLPNDDWCGEFKYGYCRENYQCDYVDDQWGCECPIETTPTPTPISNPKSESKPEGCTTNCGVPACTDQIPEAVVNPHVYRNGDSAIVKWYPKEGNRVNIYYRLNSSSEWQHSVQVDNIGYFEIHSLGSEDWTFGLQSVNGCSADGIVNASIISEVIDGNSNRWILFR